MCDWGNHYFKPTDSQPSIQAMASPKLQEQIKKSATALIEEYLSEMK